MKGIIFNLFEEVVSADRGEDAWDDVLESSGLDGAYTSLGSYPDEDLLKLVAAAGPVLGMPEQEVVRWFGRKSLPLLAARYPQFFDSHTSTRPFLLTLNDIIHPEVRKIYPGAGVPVFDCDDSAEDVLVMAYTSSRQLCAFGHGLIEGAADHYGEHAEVEQPLCMKRGDERCVFRIVLSNGR